MKMSRSLTLALAVLAPLTFVRVSHASPQDGFVPLFNGKDLTGWKVPEGDGGHWKVVDGVIDYDAGSEAKGEKSLWSEREYGNFILRLDWRLKEAPFINKNIPYILPDGTHARDIHGKPMTLPLPDADSGVYLRGDGDYQVNIWCWPIGSGEMYSIRMRKESSPELRAAVTPKHQADKPIGEWNHFEIKVVGKTVNVSLNGVPVIVNATIPDMPDKGRLALQHHGSKNAQGEWTGPPSLVQFRNIEIQELPSGVGQAPPADAPAPVRALLITGGHDHDAAFYGLFRDCENLSSLPVDTAANAFKQDLRDKYDVIIMYDFTRDLDPDAQKNLRAFVESGKGLVVLHHALLNNQHWPWWSEEVVGGRYRLQREGDSPSSSVKNDQAMSVVPATDHPVLRGIQPFQITDEAYKNLYMSPRIKPLLTTDNPTSDTNLAWVGPCATSRVVAIQLGHGPSAFEHPAYRALVHNAIAWTAGRQN